MVDSQRLLCADDLQGEPGQLMQGVAETRILQPVDFTMLKPQTRNFLKELFIQLFIASQVSSPMLSNDSGDYPSVRNRGSVEEIFLKASRIENLGLGLVFFMSNTFKGEDGFLAWASSVAKETLQAGMEHIPRI